MSLELEFKPGFKEVQAQWDLFWAGKATRPLLSAIIPKPGMTPAEKPGYAAGVEGNYVEIADQLLRWAESHDFLGEAIPFFYQEFAADHFSAYLGADLIFKDGQTGGWPVHCIDDIEEADIRFDRNGKWWTQTVEFLEVLRKKLDGRMLIASNTLVANLDALVALRGSNNVLMDMVDHPDAVHRALKQITAAHGEILDALAEILGYKAWGSINRHGMYCRGKINVPQCDFSCMIGSAMFREFVLPYLTQEMERFDAVEYHLDGPGAIRHLEDLCSIEKLDVVQWVAGAGDAEKKDWTFLYERIDKLGKGHFRWTSPEQLRRDKNHYQSRKLFESIGVKSRDEFDRLVEKLEDK